MISADVFRLKPTPADHPLVVRSSGHFARLATGLSNSVDTADITRWFPGVEDQLQMGSCSGESGAESCEVRFGVIRGHQVSKRYSGEFVYALERLAMGTFPEDSGADLGTLYSILEQAGVCTLDECPYDGNPATMPTEAARQAALANRRHGSCTVPRTPDAILAVLNSGRPVTLAVEVYDSFVTGVDRWGNVPMPRPGETLRGYHAINVFGAQRRWGPYGPNHWGTSWGENGWFRLSWDFILQHAFEAWTAS